MTLNDLCARFKVIDSLNVAKMEKYSLLMIPMPCIEWLNAYICQAYVFMHSCSSYLLTYLHSWLRRIKPAIPKRLKIRLKLLLTAIKSNTDLIATKMYELE